MLGAIAVLVFVLVSLLGCGEDGEGDTLSDAGEIVFNSAPHVAYWVGPQPGTTGYEIDTAQDRVFVRYLTDDAEPGDTQPNYLTVGSYSVPGAAARLQEDQAAGGELEEADGYVLFEEADGQRAYVVFDDEPDIQIEIFDPDAGRAAELARSGDLRPLE